MVACYIVIKQAQLIALAGFIQPVAIVVAVDAGLEQKITIVTTVRDVPYQARKVISICSRHA